MKLYNVPNRTWVKILGEPTIPPAAPIPDEVVFFDHIDGMYSYCKNQDGEVVYLAAWTEVEPLEKLK